MLDFTTMSPVFALFIGVLVVYNLVVFIVYGIDKASARANARRVPEKTLLLLALCGGSIGALLGMSFFRHKTRKGSFQFWFALVALVQIGLVVGVWYVWENML
jgi:uncharacterized membrane protein YsdA (DUF1294 family)